MREYTVGSIVYAPNYGKPMGGPIVRLTIRNNFEALERDRDALVDFRQAIAELLEDQMYTPDKDITEPLSDGSGAKVLFKAGTPIAWATARALGLVEGDEPQAKPKKKDTAPDA
jgi:hypothetical protein